MELKAKQPLICFLSSGLPSEKFMFLSVGLWLLKDQADVARHVGVAYGHDEIVNLKAKGKIHTKKKRRLKARLHKNGTS